MTKIGPTRELAISQNRLILVAEDNEVNQQVVRQQLELLGFYADIANNGREALTLWMTQRYALILSDIHMPEMDGLTLLSAVGEKQLLMRSVIVSAYGDMQIHKDGHEPRSL